MSKGGKTTTSSSTGPDAQTQAWIDQIKGYAQQAGAAGAPGANPMSTAAGNFYGSGMQAGNLGLGALSGDPNSVSQMMNPYQSNVMDANNAAWQKINGQTNAQVNSDATGAGAFGGSRYGVALGTALSANNVGQGQQNANLLQSGYNDAMTRAGSLANFGQQSAGGAANMGDYMRQIQMQQAPGYYQMQMLKQGMSGLPTGTSTNTTQQQTGSLASGLGGLLSLGGTLWGDWNNRNKGPAVGGPYGGTPTVGGDPNAGD